MTGKEDVYRGPAIRALCRITDVSDPLAPLLLFPLIPSLPSPCYLTQRKTRFEELYANFSCLLTDHHAAGYWEIHEAGYCWQGAQCVQFSPGLLTGKTWHSFKLHLGKIFVVKCGFVFGFLFFLHTTRRVCCFLDICACIFCVCINVIRDGCNVMPLCWFVMKSLCIFSTWWRWATMW